MYLTRHGDMIANVDLSTPIVIAGAGSIGSYACLALAKLGYTNITVFDDGIVEEENIAPQFYTKRCLGKLKVERLKRAINELTGTSIVAMPCRIDDATYSLATTNTLVCAVDSMSARKAIFNEVTYTNFVDARMAIEFLTIISFRLEFEKYENTLFADSFSVQEPCTNKAISYTSLIAGGLVSKAVLDLHKSTNATFFRTVNFDINNFDMVVL